MSYCYGRGGLLLYFFARIEQVNNVFVALMVSLRRLGVFQLAAAEAGHLGKEASVGVPKASNPERFRRRAVERTRSDSRTRRVENRQRKQEFGAWRISEGEAGRKE